MRIFRDLDIVEQMGSGIPRILQQYQPSVYHFTANFIRVVFPFTEGFDGAPQASDHAGTPQASDHAGTPQAPSKLPASTPQVELVLQYCSDPKSRAEIQEYLGLKDREHFRKQILLPLLEPGQLLMTLPDKPTSPKQKFYTASGTR